MNTRKLKLSGMVLTLFLSAITMSAVAQQKGANGNKGNGQQICQRIPDLTDEQDSEITKLRTEHFKLMNAYKADLGILRAELNKLELAKSADQKAIDSKIDEVFTLKTKMAKQGSQHRQKVKSLLTDEQKVFFDAHSGRGKGHRNGYGNGYGFGRKGCPRS